MLSCPNLRLTTASSLSWGGSPTSFLTRNTCLLTKWERPCETHDYGEEKSHWCATGFTRRAVCPLAYPLCLQPCESTVITAKEGSYCCRSWSELHSFVLCWWSHGIHWLLSVHILEQHATPLLPHFCSEGEDATTSFQLFWHFTEVDDDLYARCVCQKEDICTRWLIPGTVLCCCLGH